MPNQNEDLYDDSPAASGKAPDMAKKEYGGDATALISKSLCPNMKVGDEVVLKIVAEHDGEFEVAYAPEEKDEPPHDEKAEMASMKEPGSDNPGNYD